MSAGIYSIVLTCPANGIEFVRQFNVVNSEATTTITTTETVIGTVTPVSTLTSFSTITEIDTVTLPPQTVTLPNATAGVITIHP
jgi:carbohydrate-binding DOMON domain-containing protein